MLRYSPGDKFEPHYDREVPFGTRRSLLTVLVYLNDGDVDFKGGNTLFLDALQPNQGVASVPPAAGRVVIFEHGLFHSGAVVESGIKFVMRTDVLFDQIEAGPTAVPTKRTVAASVESLLESLQLSHLRSTLDDVRLTLSFETRPQKAGLLVSLEALVFPGRPMVEEMLRDIDLADADVTALADAAFAAAPQHPP